MISTQNPFDDTEVKYAENSKLQINNATEERASATKSHTSEQEQKIPYSPYFSKKASIEPKRRNTKVSKLISDGKTRSKRSVSSLPMVPILL